MFNHQKTLSYQLLVKLQDQALASQLVLNALLDEFSNIENMYESYMPTIQSAVTQNGFRKHVHHLKTYGLKEAYYLS